MPPIVVCTVKTCPDNIDGYCNSTRYVVVDLLEKSWNCFPVDEIDVEVR